jgi:hypothetical protein
MKAIEKGMIVMVMALISTMSMAQNQEQKEQKQIQPVKVNEVIQSKKTQSQRKVKMHIRVEQIQKAEKQEKE